MRILTLGEDFGPYAANGQTTIPWEDHINKLGLKFFIGQGGFKEDPGNGWSTQINLKAARSHGVEIVGEYFWLDADDDPTADANTWSKDIDTNNPDFIAYDLEQTSGMNGVTFSNTVMTNYVTKVYSILSLRYPQKQHILYSRTGLLTTWPGLIPFVKAQEVPWWAANPGWGLPVYYMSLEEIASGKMMQVTNYNVPAGTPLPWKWINIFDDNGFSPDLTYSPNAKHWMLQCGGNRRPIGAPWEFDWNYWLGDFQSMKDWVNKKAPAPVPVPVPIPVPIPVPTPDLQTQINTINLRLANIEKKLNIVYIPIVIK